jgi:hypothetical protein
MEHYITVSRIEPFKQRQPAGCLRPALGYFGTPGGSVAGVVAWA